MKEILIQTANPQPEVRRNAETAADWEFKDEAAYLYEKAIVLRERLIDPIARIDRQQLPDPVIGFENLRNYKVLAVYLLNRDEVGLSCRINFNTEHYIPGEDGTKVWRWGRWAQMETLAHEYTHLWEQQVGNGKPGHGKQFVEKMGSMGLYPLPGVGCHIAVADEPFSILMKEWGIERPDDVPTDDRKIDWFKNGKEIKGRSSLSRWSCGCQNARIGAKEFHARCTNPECGNVFIEADGVNETIYKAPGNVQLIGEANKLLTNLSGHVVDTGGFDNLERLGTLEQSAQERLFRRLDKMIASERTKPD